MIEGTVKLTAEQDEFIRKSINGFSYEKWGIEYAGRSASERRFIRLYSKSQEQSFILIIWTSSDNDWQRFLDLCEQLSLQVPLLPKIFAVDHRLGLILEEDFGKTTVKQYCLENSTSPLKIESLYRLIIDALILWQNIKYTPESTIASRKMDIEMLMWESNYFTQHCVEGYFGCKELVNDKWKNERLILAKEVSSYPVVCMHRDFQSENIMIFDNSIRFIDFQGARLGPAGYDLASLLYDPYINNIDTAMLGRLYCYYVEKAQYYLTKEMFNLCAIQRLMQALGAYTNLFMNKKKEWYRVFILPALLKLKHILEQVSGFEQLTAIISTCYNLESGADWTQTHGFS